MKKLFCIIVMIQFLLSIDIYKEIKIDKNEVDNLLFLQTLGIDIDHVYSSENFFQFAINNHDIIYLDRANVGLIPFIKKEFQGKIILRLHGILNYYQLLLNYFLEVSFLNQQPLSLKSRQVELYQHRFFLSFR